MLHMLRNGLLVLVLGTAGAAHATFEMMLAVDTTKAVIHRLDPQTDMYLGSFGAGFVSSDTYAIAVDQSANEVYFSNSAQNRMYVFDYNLGTYKRSWTTAFPTYIRDIRVMNGKVYAVGGNQVTICSTTGSASSTFTYAGLDAWGVTLNSAGEIAVLGRSGAASRIYMFNGISYSLGFTAALPGSAYSLVSTPGVNDSYYSAATGGGDIIYYLNTFSGGNLPVTSGGTRFELAAGHGDVRYSSGGSNTVTTYVLGSTAISNWTQVRSATYSQISSIGAIGMVNAPEPTTLIPIGLAIGGLALRRRRR